MFRKSLLAVGGLVALALVLPQQLRVVEYAFAQSTSSSAPSSSQPPTTSSEPVGPNDPGGNGPDIPDVPDTQKIADMEQACNAALGDLAKVPEKLVAAFASEGGVSVVPVCNSGLGRQAKIDASQALPLQQAIANNPALMAALKAHGFTADNVVGVILVEGVATLYVHKSA